MIEIDDITKVYNTTAVVDRVTLTIEPHSICVIVGTSGSGKTTLMRMINKLVEPTSGHIRIDGQDIAGIPAYEEALKAAGKRYTVAMYPDVNHAFNNDTGNRYDKAAADLAWSRTIAFFTEHLGAPPKGS